MPSRSAPSLSLRETADRARLFEYVIFPNRATGQTSSARRGEDAVRPAQELRFRPVSNGAPRAGHVRTSFFHGTEGRNPAGLPGGPSGTIERGTVRRHVLRACATPHEVRYADGKHWDRREVGARRALRAVPGSLGGPGGGVRRVNLCRALSSPITHHRSAGSCLHHRATTLNGETPRQRRPDPTGEVRRPEDRWLRPLRRSRLRTHLAR